MRELDLKAIFGQLTSRLSSPLDSDHRLTIHPIHESHVLQIFDRSQAIQVRVDQRKAAPVFVHKNK